MNSDVTMLASICLKCENSRNYELEYLRNYNCIKKLMKFQWLKAQFHSYI